MLIDSEFQAELNTVQGQQTFAFMKKAFKGLFYVDLSITGTTVSGQVRTGDGVAYAHAIDVLIKLYGAAVNGLLTTLGTALAGDGTVSVWVQTNTSGIFEMIAGGTGTGLVEATLNQGVTMLKTVTF